MNAGKASGRTAARLGRVVAGQSEASAQRTLSVRAGSRNAILARSALGAQAAARLSVSKLPMRQLPVQVRGENHHTTLSDFLSALAGRGLTFFSICVLEESMPIMHDHYRCAGPWRDQHMLVTPGDALYRRMEQRLVPCREKSSLRHPLLSWIRGSVVVYSPAFFFVALLDTWIGFLPRVCVCMCARNRAFPVFVRGFRRVQFTGPGSWCLGTPRWRCIVRCRLHACNFFRGDVS